MSKFMEVEICSQCKHYVSDIRIENDKPGCNETGKRIPKDGHIPRWCPLPDKCEYCQHDPFSSEK